MTSRTVTSVITPDTIALNAAVFGYAGHSIVTPHGAIQQIWWTNERIQAKVTRDFILSKLRLEERKKLDWRVAFGEELTDGRYIDWILERAKRMFLILVETGVPDQIFEVIDDAWDDDDLPITVESLGNLHLSRRRDEKLLRKFYSTQFSFLLRPLAAGLHIDYGQNEVLPLEYVHRLPPAAALQGWLKMHPPKQPGEIYVRRKATVGAKGEVHLPQKQDFLNDIQTSRMVKHKHVADVWASYTSKGQGYFLTSFEAEHTLKSFIDFRVAASIQKLTKSQRIELVLSWFFCLADAVANIHEQGIAHTAIMPSNILVDGENRIAFSDLGCLKSFQTDKKTDPLERYNYGAPENHINTRRSSTLTTSPPPTSRLRFSHRRWQSFDSKRSSTAKPRQGSYSSDRSVTSVYEDLSPPGLIESEKRSISTSSSASSLESPQTPTLEEDGYPQRPSRPPPPLPKDDETFQPLTLYASSWEAISSPASPPISPKSQSTAPTASNQAADIYSLGCVFVDLLTYVLKKKSNEFTKARSTKRSKSSIDLAAVSAASLPATGTPQTPTAPRPSSMSNVDASFHGNAAKVTAWLDTLASEAAVHESADDASALPRAFPALLLLARAMLNRNPALRPAAADVRLRARDALLVDARLDRLRCEWCCAAHPRAVLPQPVVRRGKDALWQQQRKQQLARQSAAGPGSIPLSILNRPLPGVPPRKPLPAAPTSAGVGGLGSPLLPRHEVTVTAGAAARKSVVGGGLAKGLQWAWPRKSFAGR